MLKEFLTSIADKLRELLGTTDTINAQNFTSKIDDVYDAGYEKGKSEGGELPPEAFVISGDCSYRFANDGWNWFAESFGDKIIMENITNVSNCFRSSKTIEDLSKITINFKDCNIQYMFNGCYNLKKLPKVSGTITVSLAGVFNSCYSLSAEEITNFLNDLTIPAGNIAVHAAVGNVFMNCYGVRDLTNAIESLDRLIHGYTGTNSNIISYSSMFGSCYGLDGIYNLYVPRLDIAKTSNGFSGTFGAAGRLKDVIFKTDNGTPYAVKWKSQTIDLSSTTGYCISTSDCINSLAKYAGITSDKRVTNADTYQALKDDPDWFTTSEAYSRYNHDSAVNTINSLPDTSAYLATAGGTNTIKLKGAAGSLTDGGAINTLTEEEIAVATAKGWTVTFA